MKKNSPKTKETIKSLRSYHAAIAALSVFGIIAILFLDNWSVWLPIAVAIFFDGKFEKADELAKQNLAKANTLIMWILFAAFAVIGMFARNSAIPAAVFIGIICALLAIRSIFFLITDTTFSKEDADV